MKMTDGRKATLAICVPVSLALIGWGAFNAVALAGTGQYTYSTPVTVSGGNLTASINGDVTLVPGQTARLAGRGTYSLIRPDVTVSRSGVSFRCVVPTGDCDMNSTLTVPPSATSVKLSSGGGDLAATAGITSNLTLSTDGGDITVSGLTGTANLLSGGGDIGASGVTAADVTARSSGGDVTLTFTKIPRDVQVDSGGGDISIVVPPGSYQFAATSDGGDVSPFPNDTASHDVITADSDGGDITVSES